MCYTNGLSCIYHVQLINEKLVCYSSKYCAITMFSNVQIII
jgi:hypothetical protein